MSFITKDKAFSKRWIIDYTYITIGSLAVAAGFVLFLIPHNIVPGGLTGIGMIVNYLTKGMPFFQDGFPIGLFGLLVNIPLTVLGIKILGPRFGIKTVVGFILNSVFIDALTYLIPAEFLSTGADFPFHDVLLSCIFGGVLIGVGLGLIFKSRATSGGLDIVAMIIAKYSSMSLGSIIIWVDIVIVILASFTFNDWQIPLYSLVAIFILGKSIDLTLEGASYNKALFIISNKHELIKEKILVDIERGGTIFHGRGMYTDDEKKILYTVVSRRELAVLERYISDIDPNAFITIMDVREILGEGFNSLTQKVEE